MFSLRENSENPTPARRVSGLIESRVLDGIRATRPKINFQTTSSNPRDMRFRRV